MSDTEGNATPRRRSVSQFFTRRYNNNPYVGDNPRGAQQQNKGSSQYPERMYRPKRKPKSDIPDEETLDILLAPPHLRKQLEEKLKGAPKGEDPKRRHFRGIELVNRHRYGDDIDILRATFTKTVEEIEQEKFQLIILSRKLCQKIHFSLLSIPKHEKYCLGLQIRKSALTILQTSIAIKKRYYRKNLLEYIDIELDTLREYYNLAHDTYPTWMTDALLVEVFNDINAVGAIVGGLLKAVVA